MMKTVLMKMSIVVLSSVVCGCGVSQQNATKNASIGLITTPASYYSSAKARYLGAKYKDNLDRLAERIVRNSKTAKLQFANNIASVGGIGFFTHSATSTADERFLEVILSAPETFEAKGELNQKILNVFTAYGRDLLAILAADADIYQEREVSGYGLNFTWRSLVSGPNGPRVALERAVIYIAKEKAKGLLDQESDANKYLAEAVIFTGAGDGPVTMASYRRQDRGPDTRLPIQEESLSGGQLESRPEISLAPDLRPEPAKQSSRAPVNGSEAQSARVGLDVSNASGKPLSSEAKDTQPFVGSQPASIREEPGIARPSRSDLRKPAEASQRSDYETMAKEPVAQAQAPLMRDPTTSEVKKFTDKSMVAKREDGAGELKKKELGSIAPPAANAGDETKPAVVARKLDSVPTLTDERQRRGEISQTAAANPKQPEASASVRSASGADNSSTILLPKNPRTQISAPNEAQPKLEKKISPITTEQPNVVKDRSRGSVSDAAATPDLKAPTSSTAERSPHIVSDKETAERIALRSRAVEIKSVTKARIGAPSKALEGFIIQLAFTDKGDARRCAEMMERRGYAVSVTEAGQAESFRVRVGNFAFREEADRELLSLKQNGLSGIVINLPQAYKPDARAPGSDKTQAQ